MERAVKGLVTGRYLWVAFTSTNAVKAVREKLEEFGLDARAFAGVKVAAVGEATAAALVEFGVQPDLVPSGQQSSEGLLADWAPYDEVFDPMDRVLLPRADIATDTLLAGLKELGWAGGRRDGLPHRAGGPAARRDPRGAQGRRLRRGAVHLLEHRAQPRRHRRQAARHDRAGLHRPADLAHRDRARAARRRAAPSSPTSPRWSRRWPSTRWSAGRPGWSSRARPAAGGWRGRQAGRRTGRRTVIGRSVRPRRLRRTPALRRLVADVRLSAADLVLPVFVKEGLDEPRADRLDAGRRPAHPGLAAQGGRRGGRGRRRRADPVRHPGGQGRPRQRRRRPGRHRAARAAGPARPSSATAPSS